LVITQDGVRRAALPAGLSVQAIQPTAMAAGIEQDQFR
jgi:hypothetical protein